MGDETHEKSKNCFSFLPTFNAAPTFYILSYLHTFNVMCSVGVSDSWFSRWKIASLISATTLSFWHERTSQNLLKNVILLRFFLFVFMQRCESSFIQVWLKCCFGEHNAEAAVKPHTAFVQMRKREKIVRCKQIDQRPLNICVNERNGEKINQEIEIKDERNNVSVARSALHAERALSVCNSDFCEMQLSCV